MNPQPTKPILQGCDVYHGDTPLQFGAMKKAGKVYCYAKATQGQSYEDPKFETYFARAKQAGLVRGAYHYFDPDANPVLQAKHFVRVAPPVKGDLVHMLDVEALSKTAPASSLGPRALLCAQTIKGLTGRYPVIYSGQSFYQEHLAATFPAHLFTLMIARYGKEAPVVDCEFWQYSEKGIVPSNPHAMDLSEFHGTMDDLLTHTF